jgi:peptide subunit release factor 1 (eRF1)
MNRVISREKKKKKPNLKKWKPRITSLNILYIPNSLCPTVRDTLQPGTTKENKTKTPDFSYNSQQNEIK